MGKQPKIQITDCTEGEDTPDAKQMLEDMMLSQLKIARTYNDCCTCCVNESLRNEMLNILKDNYEIFSNEFNEAKIRGWVNESKANEDVIETIRAKYQPQN